MKRLALLLLLILPVCAIGQDQPSDTDALLARLNKVGEFIGDSEAFLFGKTEGDLLHLAPLLSQRKEEVHPANADPGAKWFTLHLRYAGLSVDGDIGPENKFFPTTIQVADRKWLVPQGLSVGAPASRIGQVLGKPDSGDENKLTYRDMAEETVTFNIRHGVILSIEYSLYLE